MTTDPSTGDDRLFLLTLHPTYHRTGFFNVPVANDRFVRPTEGSIQLQLGNSSIQLTAKVNRSANLNGTARIMDGVDLRNWFQSHHRVMDTVSVEIVSPSRMRLGAASTRD